MTIPGTLTIARGFIKYAHRTAAEVSGAVVTILDRKQLSGSVGGRVGTTDAYLLQQRPLVFVVPLKGTVWRWPIETVTVTPEGQLSARLGPLHAKE